MKDGTENSIGSYLEKIFVKKGARLIPIETEEIFYIESSGNYVEINLQENSYLIRGSLKEIQEKLDPLLFVRIHRSHIVNLDKVKFIEPLRQGGDYNVHLVNEKKLRLSRRYKDKLDKFSLNE